MKQTDKRYPRVGECRQTGIDDIIPLNEGDLMIYLKPDGTYTTTRFNGVLRYMGSSHVQDDVKSYSYIRLPDNRWLMFMASELLEQVVESTPGKKVWDSDENTLEELEALTDKDG